MSNPTPTATVPPAPPWQPAPPGTVYRRDQRVYCNDLVIAVHGMGDQTRNEFAQSIARLFARYAINRQSDVRLRRASCQATCLPLGLWDGGNASDTDHAIAFVADPPTQPWLEQFAFAEVHWADLPRVLQKDGYRLEESKRWAASIVDRVVQREEALRRAAEAQGKKPPQQSLLRMFGASGPRLAATVIEEIIETVRLLQRLLKIAEAAGLFKFDLAHILEAYLGDVQQVTDFMGQRDVFLDRFLQRMTNAASLCPRARVHVIAHSEGSVLAFFGLLTALLDDTNVIGRKQRRFTLPDLSWIHRVQSFTTLGSPIDKHLILWPDMWHRFTKKGTAWKRSGHSIRWRNYYDDADPVGFNLDTARQRLEDWKCHAFEFDAARNHDHGFRRYLLPGKAHIDYFQDDGLFEHIIEHAIKDPPPGAAPREPDVPNRCRGRLSMMVPFALVVVIHFAAMFIFHRALAGDPVEVMKNSGNAADRALMLAAPEGHAFYAGTISTLGIVGCAMLLLGTTVLARTGRLAREPLPWFGAMLCFVGGCVMYWLMPGLYTLGFASWLGVPADVAVLAAWDGFDAHWLGLHDAARRLVMPGLALFVVVVAWLADWWRLRQMRPPVWGLRWMILLGGVPLSLLVVIPRLRDGFDQASALMLLLSMAAFLYLWWFGALLFDLAYCWKHYINTSDSLIDKVSRCVHTEKPADEAERLPGAGPA